MALLGGDGGIPVDELCEDPSQGLNAQGEGSHIQQQQVLHVLRLVSRQDGSLHS